MGNFGVILVVGWLVLTALLYARDHDIAAVLLFFLPFGLAGLWYSWAYTDLN
jgi:hypothetical protein